MTTADDPFLARLAALDDALAYQAQLNIKERDPAKAAACDNARLGIGMARDAYRLQALAAVKAPDDIDALLLEVADAGVGRLVLECRPSRSRSLYVATWTQEGRKMMREARSVGAVLRRVVRAAGAVSGAPGRKGQAA